MRSRYRRLRIASVGAGLVLAASSFAPAALSHGNPHGRPPGQTRGGVLGPAPASLVHGHGHALSASPAAGHSHGLASGALPPGQANKIVSPPGAPPAPAAAPNALPPGQAKKLAGGPQAVSHGQASHIPPGQAKKAAAAAVAAPHNAAAAAASLVAKVPPGQAKKTAPAAATPAVTPAAPASPAASSPAPSHHASKPGAKRASTQRRSSRGARARRAARASARAARRTTSARVARAAVARGALSTAASPAAGTRGQTSLGRHRVSATAAHRGLHPASSTGTIPTLSNILPVPLPVPDWSKPIILLLVLLCVLLGLRVWLSSRRAHRLDSQRRRLTADLASLQPALVPDIPARFGRLAVSVAYRPADGPAAGGDFYDAFALEGGRVAVMVGDVSGHGRAALTRAAHMRYMLRAYVETGLDPRSALKLGGRVLGADPDALFATVAVAVYDAGTSTLTYATAGHPAPVLLGPGAHEPLTNCASPALGWGAPTGRRQTTIPFSEGARAVFFSDGVTEVRTKQGLLGRKRLAEIAADTNPAHAAGELLERVQAQASVIRDDMAACIVEATAGAAVSEHRIDELEVEPRHLKSGQGERFLAACGVPSDEARPVLAQAAQIAAETGSALLRAEVAGHVSTATALHSGPVSLAIPPSLTPDSGAAPRSALSTDPAGPAVALG